MGYGMDEDWEPEEDERELTQEEKSAIKKMNYDEEEWRSLSYWERREKIHLSKFF